MIFKNNKNKAEGLSRRKFLGGTLAAVAAGSALPGCRFVAGSGDNTIPEPPDFPEDIDLYQQGYINWAREIKVNGVWSCSPKNSNDVARLANWANANNYRLRPFGSGHGFAPTLLPRDDSGQNILLVNTADFLNSITVNADADVPSVSAQAGALIENICIALEVDDLGLYHTPAPGGVTIAGGLAMNVHGAAIPAEGEVLQPGHSWGTLSNLVLELTAVVWDESQGLYVLRTFTRDDPAIGPLLTCVARAFVTDVVLQAGPNLKIRCVSRSDLKISELLAAPDSQSENSFANLSNQYGTVDILYYPFHSEQATWVKTWTVTPVKPENSREVFTPYNYQDDLVISPLVADIFASGLRSFPRLAVPSYNNKAMNTVISLIDNEDPDTKINDLWGSAYTTTLYVSPKTPRNTVAAWGVIVSRDNMQRALSEFYTYFVALIDSFKDRGLYPYTGPVELRAHGLDRADDVLIPNAVEPMLSGARPNPEHPEKDTIIWFAINNNVDQPDAAEFNTQLETWFLTNYQSYGIVRPEWTKCYAYTLEGSNGGGWTNDTILHETFPATWRDGYNEQSNWDAAVAMLNAYDPQGIFSNTYLDRLFPA